MDPFEQMAHDAGYRGDEARQVAAAIEESERRRQWEQEQFEREMYELEQEQEREL